MSNLHYTVTGAAEWAWFNSGRREREAQGGQLAALRWFTSRVEVLQAIRLHPHYATNARIAAMTGLKARTVQRAVADLVTGGLLLRVPRRGQANGFAHPLQKTPAAADSPWCRMGSRLEQVEQEAPHDTQSVGGGASFRVSPPHDIQNVTPPRHSECHPSTTPSTTTTTTTPGTRHEYEGVTVCGKPVSRTDTTRPPDPLDGGGGSRFASEEEEADQLVSEARAVLAPLGVTPGSPVEALSMDYAKSGGTAALLDQAQGVKTAKNPAGALAARMKSWDTAGRPCPAPTQAPKPTQDAAPSPVGSSPMRVTSARDCRSCSIWEERDCACSEPEPFESDAEQEDIHRDPKPYQAAARRAREQFSRNWKRLRANG